MNVNQQKFTEKEISNPILRQFLSKHTYLCLGGYFKIEIMAEEFPEFFKLLNNL